MTDPGTDELFAEVARLTRELMAPYGSADQMLAETATVVSTFLTRPDYWAPEYDGEWIRISRDTEIGRAVYHWPAEIVVPPSPWLSWKNYDCVSMPFPDPAVRYAEGALWLALAGRKPVGGDIVWGIGNPDEDDMPIMRAYYTAIAKTAERNGLLVEFEATHGKTRHRQWLQISDRRTFGALFDLAAIADVYEAAAAFAVAHPEAVRIPEGESAWVFRGTDRASLLALADVPVAAAWKAWDWRAGGANSFPAQGLALGYPLEATIAGLYGWDQFAWLDDQGAAPRLADEAR